MEYLLLIIGFALLIKGADLFIDGSSNLAKSLKIPTLVIGLTIVAFGTSAPEAMVSIVASINNSNEIATGNVIGSNIFNLLVVLGVSAMIKNIKASREVITKDFLFLIFATVILIIFMFDKYISGASTNLITNGEGMVLVLIAILYTYSLILTANEEKRLKVERHKLTTKDIGILLLGITGIIIGGNIVVDSAEKIAINLGISKNLIGLTIVSMGTSLPELVTSIVAVKKGEKDIAIGNVIGSNIFNILFVLGISSSISAMSISQQSLIDAIILLIVSVMCYVLTCFKSRIGKTKGLLMVLAYVVFMIYIVIR